MAQRSAVHATDASPAARTMRPIDLIHLAKQCLGDEFLEHEVLRLFDTTMTVYCGRLQTAVSAEDIRMALHSIKGAASGVGAWTIADLAKAGEIEFQASGALSAELISDMALAQEEVHVFITDLLRNDPA